jgi:predicted DNA-binding transcriptional regulator YafY
MRLRRRVQAFEEIRELHWHPEQRITTTPDGEAILELPAQSIKEARRFVLAYGKDAVALEPPELVEDLRRETDAMAKAYPRQTREPRIRLRK